MAVDSDNEKRMEKAENRAERKLAKKRKTREARMKEDSAPKSSVPPGTLRPFPAKGVEPVKAAETSLQFPVGTSCFGMWRPQPLEEGMPKSGYRGSAVSFFQS